MNNHHKSMECSPNNRHEIPFFFNGDIQLQHLQLPAAGLLVSLEGSVTPPNGTSPREAWRDSGRDRLFWWLSV